MEGSKLVVVLGASPKPSRYSNMAVRQLQQAGYKVIPVNPAYSQVEGIDTVADLDMIKEPVHTLTIYIKPAWSEKIISEIINLKPERVIFNPGTESARIKDSLTESGISFLDACTLVMLSTKQFDN